MSNNYGFETLQLHAGQVPDPVTGARAVPIYQTTSYVFKDSIQAAKLFSLDELGFAYTRIGNPTQDVLENRIAALEGGTAALAVASGAAAITYAILNVATSGDEVVAASTLYGGTYNLLNVTLPEFGVKTTFVNPDEPENFRKAITDKTKAFFIESIGNPGINLIDIKKIADIAHEYGIPLIVDNTFATPYLLRPIDYGADVVVYSATKFLGGHGNSIAGLIVDSGKFDWEKSGRFPKFTVPNANYEGKRYVDFAPAAFVTKIRIHLLRDTGAAISPFNAFLIIQGIETLSLRLERHIENTRKLVNYLKNNPDIGWVNYPELEENKYNNLAKQYFPKGAGAIFTFGIKADVDVISKFIDSLKLFSHLANVGDAKSLIIHPSISTHRQLNTEEQLSAGITPDLVRISAGIETAEDLIADIEQALNKAFGR